MATDTTLGAPAGPVGNALERAAWGIPLATRRLFVVMALTAAGALAVGGVAATWVAARNADTIDDARESGLGLASAVTEFGTRLAAFDADAATMLLPGGLDRTTARPGYDRDLLESGRSLAGYDPNLALASRALVDAGLVATDEDREDLRTLNDGLVRYNGLVEEARANARQGNPVAAVYLQQARTVASEDLFPIVDRLRRTGEQRVARAANSVGGPLSGTGVALLGVALVVLVVAALVAAGRTRRAAHPALLVAMVVAILAMVLVTSSIWSQSRELRSAATDEIDAFVEANETAAALSDLRVTEIAAVATQGSGATHYTRFRHRAARLEDRLSDDVEAVDLLEALRSYVDGVGEVEDADLRGQRVRAQRLTLEGASATHFRLADDTAAGAVVRSAADLEDRFDAVADAGIEPLLPVILGALAASLTAYGVWTRARRYHR